MMGLKSLTPLFAVFLITSASPLNETQPRSSCTVTSYSEVANAAATCTDITIRGISVPAGRHTLDGQGPKYWDGTGDKGRKKPRFFYIQATGGSVFKNIKLLNCPKQCVAISDSDDLTLNYWTIDSSAGDKLGRNTDGFDISHSNNIAVLNSQVKNQDDCVCINQGSNMKFSNLWCYGGHGLSLAVGQDKVSHAGNVVSNIEFVDSYVINSRNGIHIKTQPDAATGSVTGVTYRNIQLSGPVPVLFWSCSGSAPVLPRYRPGPALKTCIPTAKVRHPSRSEFFSLLLFGNKLLVSITYYGINVEEDYVGSGPTGHPVGNIPIVGLTMSGITGTMHGEHSVPVYILCGAGGCSDWKWNGISLRGNQQSSSCNFSPSGFSC
ncbi:hypothetical protein NQ317_003770 [Molorchus minor]|uniref:Endo-polygalacturonase n=1 Tax=Molorchus minor TaxID=1323400 RepID=A0ABQ9J198_9CUCU|nr:hypothetical protein NQ317_003770 [Molorchus minor]